MSVSANWAAKQPKNVSPSAIWANSQTAISPIRAAQISNQAHVATFAGNKALLAENLPALAKLPTFKQAKLTPVASLSYQSGQPAKLPNGVAIQPLNLFNKTPTSNVNLALTKLQSQLNQSKANTMATNLEKQGNLGKVLTGIGGGINSATGLSTFVPSASASDLAYQKVKQDMPDKSILSPYNIGAVIGYAASLLPMMATGGGATTAAIKEVLPSEIEHAAELAATKATEGVAETAAKQTVKGTLKKLVVNTLKNQAIGTAYQAPLVAGAGAKNGENLQQIGTDLVKSQVQMLPYSAGLAGLGAGVEALGNIKGNKAALKANMVETPTNAIDGLGAKSLSPQRTQALLADEAGNKTYVVNNFDKSPNAGENTNKIAQSVIDRTSSEENANKAQTNNFSKDILHTVPNIEDRQAATIYAEMPKEEISAALQGKDAQIYDGENLIKQLENSDAAKMPKMSVEYKANQQKISDVQSLVSQLNKNIPKNIKNLDRVQNIDGVVTTPRKLLVAAQNLKGEAQLTAQNATDFTGQIGAFSKERGTLDGTVPNYLKHEYNQPDINSIDAKTLEANKQTALQNKISLKLSNGTGTNVNAERVYKNYITAMLHGENPKTLDLARLVSKTGNEMAHKNAVAGMLDDLTKNDIAVVGKRVLNGYKEVGQGAGDLKIQLPKQLAKALTPVLDEKYGQGYGGKNWTDAMNNIKKIKLGFSAFHYKNLAIAAANDGDFKPIMNFVKNIPNMQEYLRSADYRDLELDLVKHTGMTSAVESNMDTGRGLNPSETTVGRLFDQIGKLPVFKQAGQIMDANNKVLFEDMQSVYKVQGYAVKVAAWAADHKGATTEELDAAKNSIARHINGVFGGLNWKSLRVPKQLLGTMRMLMLAPDWTYSNIDVAKTAFNAFNHSAGAGEARKFWVRNVILGFATLESANIAFTGHGTWMNPKGHELNVEVSPGVYVTTLDGLMKDAATLTGDITKSGSGGITQFAESKLNPLASTALGLAEQRNYYGQSLIDKNGNPLKTTANNLNFAAQQLSPVPFGATGLYNYAKDPNAKKSALGVGLIGTGLGSYSSDAKVNPAEPQAGNWMYNLTPQGKTDAAATNSVKAFKAQSTANTKALKAEIAKGNKNAGQLAQKYGKTTKEVQTEIKSASKPPIKGVYYGGRQVSISGDTTKYPAFLKSYASMSQANQKTQYNKMTIGQRQLLNQQIKDLIGK
jgi:hypothetical protein